MIYVESFIRACTTWWSLWWFILGFRTLLKFHIWTFIVSKIVCDKYPYGLWICLCLSLYHDRINFLIEWLPTCIKSHKVDSFEISTSFKAKAFHYQKTGNKKLFRSLVRKKNFSFHNIFCLVLAIRVV